MGSTRITETRTVVCPKCRHRFEVPASDLKATCPNCGGAVRAVPPSKTLETHRRS